MNVYGFTCCLKVSIHKHEPLARLGLMHLIATNMCVWMSTLINEIMEESHHYLPSTDTGNNNNNNTSGGVSQAGAQSFLLNTTGQTLTSTTPSVSGKWDCGIVHLLMLQSEHM